MRIRLGLHLPFAAVLLLASMCGVLAQSPIVFVDQGANWGTGQRLDFYGRDQGSRMIPLDWLQALKQPNGQPFLTDSLARYGYLPNAANPNGLPVGFVASGPEGAQTVGMTCSACHTRQITVAGTSYRIDGGPAIVDFQSFLSDLDTAVGTVVANDAAFAPFAATVLHAPSPSPADTAALRQSVDAWYLRYHTLISRALPRPPAPAWGPSRLDAVGMIFNRLTGLDLGQPPTFLIPDNIKTADAAVRYPFLWNAPKQDQTQWAGFADNGNDILGLSRNLGEVFGVFAVYQPTNDGLIVNYLNNNSANFDGLSALEGLIKKIGPPRWPWQIKPDLAGQGKAIFERPSEPDPAKGGCIGCHGISPGKVRFLFQQTWKTPVQVVGTDTRQYDILGWSVNTGVLQGAFIPFVTDPLEQNDKAFNVLANSVIGSIAEHLLSGGGGVFSDAALALPNMKGQAPRLLRTRLPPTLRDLEGAFRPPSNITDKFKPQLTLNAGAQSYPRGSYESRVMEGIWAAAPYLHNGSVPTLAELLKPAAERVKKFKIGSAYDLDGVGLATEQTQFGYELETTGCSDLNSGRSNCGHEFGTGLSPDEKRALLEYLKTL
jgi:mono/diheme cytochrome c family protein